jgi:hypothetical protein
MDEIGVRFPVPAPNILLTLGTYPVFCCSKNKPLRIDRGLGVGKIYIFREFCGNVGLGGFGVFPPPVVASGVGEVLGFLGFGIWYTSFVSNYQYISIQLPSLQLHYNSMSFWRSIDRGDTSGGI